MRRCLKREGRHGIGLLRGLCVLIEQAGAYSVIVSLVKTCMIPKRVLSAFLPLKLTGR